MMSNQTPPQVFDRRLVQLRRARSGAAFKRFDFLHRRAMSDIADRLESINRDFPKAAFAGAGDLISTLPPAAGVGAIYHMDMAASRLGGGNRAIIGDEEALPFAAASFDLFVSLLTLHSTNDFVGALAQARAALKPDGLFIAAIFGEQTLSQLRRALYTAEAEISGGVSARIAPCATIQDCGQALTRAGYALPVVDIDKVTVRYSQPIKLLHDLRGMGETSILADRPKPLTRQVLDHALQNFHEGGGEEQFDIIFLTGWAPHDSQQQPLKPGSATTSLKTAIRG